jgi:Leucine-rich repeat (LRR) protein
VGGGFSSAFNPATGRLLAVAAWAQVPIPEGSLVFTQNLEFTGDVSLLRFEERNSSQEPPPTPPTGTDHIGVNTDPHGEWLNIRVFPLFRNGVVTESDIVELVASGKIPQDTTHLFILRSVGDFSLSFLSELPNLQELDATGGRFDDFTPLFDLPNLTRLRFRSSEVSSRALAQLSGLTNLERLELRNINTTGSRKVSDISFVSGLTNLIHLDLGFNEISDLSPLRNLTSLMYLDLVDNQISDLTPLYGLTNLVNNEPYHEQPFLYISLLYNPVTSEQIESLRNHLAKNSTRHLANRSRTP